MISFGLVGGNEKDGKRTPMSVEEVTELYKKTIPRIFKKLNQSPDWKEWASSWIAWNVPSNPSRSNCWKGWFKSWICKNQWLAFGQNIVHWRCWLELLCHKISRIQGIPLIPYTQNHLAVAIRTQFGDAKISDINYNGCVAGAVASQYNEDLDHPDVLEIFDSAFDSTRDEKHIPEVTDVLLASSDAPIFFEGPHKMYNKKQYIDGGVVGK